MATTTVTTLGPEPRHSSAYRRRVPIAIAALLLIGGGVAVSVHVPVNVVFSSRLIVLIPHCTDVAVVVSGCPGRGSVCVQLERPNGAGFEVSETVYDVPAGALHDST